MTACNMTVIISLDKYSTSYAFWLGSYTNEGQSGVIISQVFAETDMRGSYIRNLNFPLREKNHLISMLSMYFPLTFV